ncbi:TetR/AcrR family transcriptional regulator [Bradyrhizobium yuanmingense]|uniref:TetR/AcrR family transcriptional regulator n=1 Tax=Bradyrhizobium yuanmingense TaxID=108015 RepID=UPI00351910DC
MIDAALQLAAEGAEVSVREAARRAAVSPGAPFRHFPNRDALMAAAAEEAQRRFRAEIDAALREAPAADPLARFRAFGLAYLRWAMRNPAHFEIISTGRYFAHGSSPDLTRDNAELISLTEQMLVDAAEQGPATVGRPQAHPDRRARPRLRFGPHESRWPFPALGRRGGRDRADGGGGDRPVHRRYRKALAGQRLWSMPYGAAR